MKIVLKNFVVTFSLFFSFVYSSIELHSQNSVIDSLQKKLIISKEDTAKVNLLNSLSDQYKRVDTEKIKQYSDSASQLANKLGFKKGIAASLINQGIYYRMKGDFPKSIEIFNQTLAYCKKEKLNKQEALCYMGIGVANDYLGKFEEALLNYEKSLKILQRLNDKKGLSQVYMGMAVVYDFQGNYTNAIEYHLKSLHIQEELKDKFGMGGTLMNIATVYKNLGQNTNALPYYLKSMKIREELEDKAGLAQTYNGLGSLYRGFKEYEKALDFYEKSLKIRKALGDKNGEATIMGNIGSLYSDKGEYEKSIVFFMETLKIKEAVGDKNGASIALANIGISMLKLKKYDEAITYCLEGNEIAEKSGIKFLLKENYMNLSLAYEGKGEFKEALKYHQLLGSIKDSLYSESSTKQIAEMQTKYDTEKNKKEIELLNKDKIIQSAELDRANTVRNSFIGGFVLVLALVFFVLRGYRQKQKANALLSEQKAEIEVKNSNLESAYEIIEEKNKDILDSIHYAKRIQQSLLPTEKYIDKSLKRLREKGTS